MNCIRYRVIHLNRLLARHYTLYIARKIRYAQFTVYGSTCQEQINGHLLFLVAKRRLNCSTDTLGRITEQCTPSSFSPTAGDTGIERSRSCVDARQGIAVIGPEFAMCSSNHVRRDGRGRSADLRDERGRGNRADDIFYVVCSVEAVLVLSE